jgi:tetratricopeptide (TPR) repeat protein
MKTRVLSLSAALILVLTLLASCGQAEKSLTAAELLDLGHKYLLEENYDEAILTFEKLIGVEERNPLGYIGAAMAHMGLEDPEAAALIVEQGLDAASDEDGGALTAMLALIESGDYSPHAAERIWRDAYAVWTGEADAVSDAEPGQDAETISEPEMISESEPAVNSGDDPYLGLSEDEYRKLNRFFDPFTHPAATLNIRTDGDVVWFGCWLRQYEGWDSADIPEKEVEAALSRYFGVEKVYHEAVDENSGNKYGMPVYRNGFYSFNADVGGEWTWANVSSYTGNGDGTFTAVVSIYFTDLTRYPGDVGEIEVDHFTDSQYEPVSKWKLPSGTKIVDGSDGSDMDIERLSTDTVILKPYVHNGEQTWQITNINGLDIPKVLFANAADQNHENDL